jgi:AcrR family transcriptional regulator
MDATSNSTASAIAELPRALRDALRDDGERAPKRERTRRQLLEAAADTVWSHGLAGTTIQRIATTAGVATATVYNHFRTRDEILHALGAWVAEALCERIADSCAGVASGAERMAIGNRRWLWLAAESPRWALLVRDLAGAVPDSIEAIARYPLADLRTGVRQKHFRVASEAAAMDMIQGTILRAMITIATGRAAAHHDVAIATTVLRGLGMAPDAAAAAAKVRLPEFRERAGR